MKKLKSQLLSKTLWWHGLLIGILVALVGYIGFVNHQPDTWLSGWDTLHPEFNFPLNLERVIDGTWREEQGLGALAAHSHMSELPRILLLQLMSLVLPTMYLRYVYMMFCLGFGVIGMYVLVAGRVAKPRWSMSSGVGGFISALVYLLNLGTLQHFYVPFEMFPTQFAFLPWLFWLVLEFIESGKKRFLLMFMVFSFFSSPMAYASLLWFAYFAGLNLTLLGLILWNRSRKIILRSIFVFLMVIATNAYWLLPNIYFVLNGSNVVSNASINQIFSPEAFLHNKNYGTFKDTVILKNFLFSWLGYDHQSDQFVDLMASWKEHLSKPLVLVIGYITFVVSFLGVILSILKKNKYAVVMISMVLLSLIMLINMNPPFDSFFSYLRENFSLFKEGLRFPFTKFSILFMAGLSIYAGIAVSTLLETISKKTIKLILGISVICISSLGLSYYMYPYFQGQLIDKRMQVKIPEEYFELFEFANKLPHGRIAVFPVQTMWGWEYFDWGFQGAGFVWFGLDHSVLVRDFDRWQPNNENFYKEVSFALYNQTSADVKEILTKYQVDYLLVDTSIIQPGADEKILATEHIDNLLQTEDFKEIWTKGKLRMYQVLESESLNTAEVQLVNTNSTYREIDSFQRELPNFQNSYQSNFYPFSSLDRRNGIDIGFSNEGLSVEVNPEKLNTNLSTIKIPNLLQSEDYLPIDVFVLFSGNSLQYRLEYRNPVIVANDVDLTQGKKVWVQDELSLPSQQVRYLSINDDIIDLLPVLSEPNKEKVMGTIYLDTKTDTSIKFYTANAVRKEDFLQTIKETVPRDCANPNNKKQIEMVGREFRIESGPESICLGASFISEAPAIFLSEFKSQADEGLLPWFCISTPYTEGCLNEVIPKGLHEAGGWTQYYSTIALPSGEYFFDFVVQGKQETMNKNITYKDLELYQFNLVAEERVNLAALFVNSIKEETYSLNEPIRQLSITIPNQALLKEDFRLARGNLDKNCSVLQKGIAKKTKSILGVIYTAEEDGVSCDYYDYLKLSHEMPYVLRLKGENSMGRGLKMYLYNRATGRMDIETLLDSGNFDNAFVIQPKFNQETGYVVNLETRAYGKEKAQNTLNEISFWPIPLRFLSNIHLSNNDIVENNRLIGSIYFVESKNWINTINIPSDTDLLISNTAFDKGWVAIVQQGDSTIDTIQRLLSNQKLEHGSYNGWANGWIIDGDTVSQRHRNTNNNSFGGLISEDETPIAVVIVYWPQYLQWLGFGLLGLSIAGIAGVSVWKRFNNRK